MLLAGASGMLGTHIAEALLDHGDVGLHLLLRDAHPSDPAKRKAIVVGSRGAQPTVGSLSDLASLDSAVDGVDVIVSAVQGSVEVIVDGQLVLAEADQRHGVGRFVPSDFALDISGR